MARLRADPQGFLDSVKTPVILDEVQNVPEVFAFVRSRIDRQPRRTGQWLLTGSQETPLMRGVSESMAGRAAVLQLYPLSARETPKVTPNFWYALDRPLSVAAASSWRRRFQHHTNLRFYVSIPIYQYYCSWRI